MPTEQFANNQPTNTVSTNYSAAATNIVMNGVSGYPSSPQFRLLCQRTGEVLLVTALAGTTLTVTRGAESTTPYPLVTGDALAHILTAGALYNIGNTMRVVASPPSLTADFFSAQSPATYPPASDTGVTARGIEVRSGQPNWSSSVAPPSGYPVTTNFTVQIRARFVCPTGLGGAWNFYYNTDDGCEIAIFNDAAWTTQVGSTIGALGYSSTATSNGNITLTAGQTYYYRARWGQGAGGYYCQLQYTPPGGARIYLTDGQTISGVIYDSPFRAIGGIYISGDTRLGDRIDLLTGAGAVSSWTRILTTGSDAQFNLPTPPFSGQVRLLEPDGTLVNNVPGPFNGGEFIRIGTRT